MDRPNAIRTCVVRASASWVRAAFSASVSMIVPDPDGDGSIECTVDGIDMSGEAVLGMILLVLAVIAVIGAYYFGTYMQKKDEQ